MGQIKIRYLVAKPRKNGAARYYWQPKKALLDTGSFLVLRLSDDPVEAVKQAEEENAKLDRWYAGQPIDPPPADPKSVRGVADRWQDDDDFTGLGTRTQRDHLYYLKSILKWCGDAPIDSITRKLVKGWYRKTKREQGAAFARHAIATLRRLLQFAVDDGDRADNPAIKMKVAKPRARKHVWADAQLAAFCDAAVTQGWPSVALAARLMWGLGQREGDVLHLARDVWDGRRVTLVQAKTGTRVSIRPLPELAAELARLTASKVVDMEGRDRSPLVVCETTGRAWGGTHFQHTVAEIRAAAGLPATLWISDLRRTAGTNLGRAGCTEDEIMAITGHLSREVVSTYVVPDTTIADNAMRKLGRKRRRERKLDASVGRQGK